MQQLLSIVTDLDSALGIICDSMFSGEVLAMIDLVNKATTILDQDDMLSLYLHAANFYCFVQTYVDGLVQYIPNPGDYSRVCHVLESTKVNYCSTS